MPRTVGRRIRPGERRRIECDHCNALFDKRLLRRDGEGLWTCQQEGTGKDGATLSRGNAEHLRGWVERLRVPPEITGRYGVVPVDAISPITAGILTETGLLLVTEAGDPLVIESEVTLSMMGTEDGDSLETEGGELLEL